MKVMAAIFRLVLAVGLAAPFIDAAMAQSPGQAHVGGIAGLWRIKALRNASGRLVLIPAGTSAKTALDIQPEGRWSAYLGCNRMSGRLFQRGEKIEVDDRIISTKMACNEEMGDLERRFLAVFVEAGRIMQHNDKATLSDRHGRNLMVLAR